MQDGHHLAELIAHYRAFREDYLAWVDDRSYEPSLALPNYRRALVAWYEASIDPVDAYEGDAYQYITALAGLYYGAPTPEAETFLGGNPLDYIPRTIRLDEHGQRLLNTITTSGPCKEALLLADYHQLAPAALDRLLDDAPQTIATCRQTLGTPSPEAPRYKSVITLAGRLDLIHTLEREEAGGSKPTAPAPAAPVIPVSPTTPAHRSFPPSRPRSFPLPSLPIIIAGILFGILGWLAYDTFAAPSPEGLFTEYFTPYPSIFADAPPVTEADRDLQRILYYYDRGDYRTAYDELLPTADYYAAAPLYLGVSALALNDPARAIEWLTAVEADSPFKDAAEWYEALAHLNLGADAGARSLLERLAGSVGHPYRERAAELLSDL